MQLLLKCQIWRPNPPCQALICFHLLFFVCCLFSKAYCLLGTDTTSWKSSFCSELVHHLKWNYLSYDKSESTWTQCVALPRDFEYTSQKTTCYHFYIQNVTEVRQKLRLIENTQKNKNNKNDRLLQILKSLVSPFINLTLEIKHGPTVGG